MSEGDVLEIEAEIENIEYEPLMCRENLSIYTEDAVRSGVAFGDSSFLVESGGDRYAFSHWVSPKRTRSYPRARVYDTYRYGNRVTVIPLVKDEGKDGDRDYLQWDTLSLMSLLQVYVIIGYYDKAVKNPSYDNKITNQEFNYSYIYDKFQDLKRYKSDALHWNLREASNLDEAASRAEKAYYGDISGKTGVEMKSKDSFQKRMQKISEEADRFKELSRSLAREAQNREAVTIQPKESTVSSHDKAVITITNYLGGEYYFTVDEAVVDHETRTVYLIEKKHTSGVVPSIDDIKNGLVLMILFTNLDKVEIDDEEYNAEPVLGITGNEFPGYASNHPDIQNNIGEISSTHRDKLTKIFSEANHNQFHAYVVNADNEDKEQELIEAI